MFPCMAGCPSGFRTGVHVSFPARVAVAVGPWPSDGTDISNMATIAAAVTHWQFLISRLLTDRSPVQLTRFRALDIIEPHSFLSPDAIMGRRRGITAISRRINKGRGRETCRDRHEAVG